MFEWINNTFGVSNEVSVPTFISIIVFIVGGVISYFYNLIRNYRANKNIRIIFRMILKEIINDLRIKEGQMKRFYPTVNMSHKDAWILPFVTVGYLETMFELDYSNNFSAFKRKFYIRKKLKYKAFHRIWAFLRDIKYLEDRLERTTGELMENFNLITEQYSDKIVAFSEFCRKHLESIDEQISPPETKIDQDILRFSQELSDIFKRDSLSNQNEGTYMQRTYKNLVMPILVLTENNKHLKVSFECNVMLQKIKVDYKAMDNLIIIYQRKFKNYYRTYRVSSRVLKVCLKILD
ncbi:MAG: hypothetical protein DI588_09970 [Flavobacterium johnsoniae]|nr:MAG: hypothetical protein DI588_09970 [Flavobacterium johnsoniae]